MKKCNSHYIYLIEDDYISEDKLKLLFNGSAIDFEAIVKHPFVKYNDSGQLAFSYVGIISLNNFIICFFPKYYKRNREVLPLEDMICILKMLKKVGSKENLTPDYRNYSTNYQSYGGEFVIANYLIKDYLDHGLYQKEYSYIELNQPGEINWQKTINEVVPIFSKQRPIYADTFNNVSYSSSSHLITELQKYAVRHLLMKYGLLLDYKFRMYEDTADRLEDIGPKNYLIHVIVKELTQVFTDQKIQLLKLLLAFLKSEFTSSDHSACLFGTGYFHTIWERICSHSFSNQVDMYLSKMPKPIWNDLMGNQIDVNTFRPDIVHYSVSKNVFFILDAKYYLLNLQKIGDKLDVNGNPGIGDISKQFIYEKAFQNLGKEHITNALLFPKLQDMPFQIEGFVSLSLFPDRKIWILYIEPRLLIENFINNKMFSDSLISEIANAIP